jgi:hypothetical protein
MAVQQVVRREFTEKLVLVLAILFFLLSAATMWWFLPGLIYPDTPQLDDPPVQEQSLLPTSMLLISIVEINTTTYLKNTILR